MREQRIHTTEVQVNGICFRKGEVLIAKRADTRVFYPGKWETGGGQLEAEESFEEGVVRQMKEELGVLVEVLGLHSTFVIPKPDGKIPGVTFICKFHEYIVGNEPMTSSEHTEWRWQPVENLEGIDFIHGVKEKIESAYAQVKERL